MSKSFLTPKALANRMKSKGLQRLRWYCQMCEKQCRDENGFKCHCQSEAHLQQMALFASSASSYIDRFSQQFVDGFVEELRRKGGRRVKANHVYTAYIADKGHVHMNATKFDSLSAFVSFLGKQRLAEVTQDEEGELFVQYLDRDPRVLARQEELARKEGRERSAEAEERRRIDAEVEEARRRRADGGEQTADCGETEDDKRRRDEEEATRLRQWRQEGEGARLTLSLQPSSQTRTAQREGVRANPLLSLSSAAARRGGGRQEEVGEKRRSSALQQIVEEEEERRRTKQSRQPLLPPAATAQPSPAVPSSPSPPSSSSSASLRSFVPPSFSSSSTWLCPSLVVRILSRSLEGGSLYRQKGRVVAVDEAEGRTATVSLLPSEASTAVPLVVQCDRRELETVIPPWARRSLSSEGRGKAAWRRSAACPTTSRPAPFAWTTTAAPLTRCH